MNFDIVGEIRDGKNNGELLGTCFLINPTYILTAAHVVKDIEENNLENLDIIFKFIKIVNGVLDIIYLDYDNIDFAILKLKDNIDKNLEYIEMYATIALEKGDEWESVGYPEDSKHYSSNKDKEENKYSYVYGNIIREINNEKYDYELCIQNQKDNTDWKGLSGAPLIVDNKIVGIISAQKKGNFSKTTIKVISIQKIIEFLLNNNQLNILELFSYKKKNLLTDRIDEFQKNCEESFFFFKYSTDEFSSDCLVLRNDHNIEDIAQLVNIFLSDYANQLNQLILLEDKSLGIRRKQRQLIDEITCQMKEELIKNGKISLVVLWIILEGKYRAPRLASTYSLVNDDLKQDIYIYKDIDGVKLLIGYSEMKENILDSIRQILNEVEQERLAEEKESRIIMWDDVAINSLDIATKFKVEQIRNEQIQLEIMLLHSYNSEIYSSHQYKSNGNNNEIVENIMKKELNNHNQNIAKVCSQFKWIKDIKINWISLPVSSLEEFIKNIG